MILWKKYGRISMNAWRRIAMNEERDEDEIGGRRTNKMRNK